MSHFLIEMREESFLTWRNHFIICIVKTGNFYKGQIISESLHVQVAYNFVIYILAWGYCLLCPLKVLTGSLRLHSIDNSSHVFFIGCWEPNINLKFKAMKSNPNCPNCTCKLLRKMEVSTDLFAFIDENCPIEVVLENVHEASKNTLECTCYIYGNILWVLGGKRSRWQRLKNKFREFINRFVKAC